LRTLNDDDAEIRAAAGVIHDVVFDLRRHDPQHLVAAHDTLARHRHRTPGPVADAIRLYLADDTWRHGPHELRRAIRALAHHLDIPDPSTAHISEQATLFGPSPDSPMSARDEKSTLLRHPESI
jgi:hypothetical protein